MATSILTPQAPPRVSPRSPGAAWLISLLVPGAGQMYCAHVKRGLITLFFFAASFGVTVWLLGAEEKSDLLLGMALRTAIILYAFASLDAYFTAREINAGIDAYNTENPRVAAALNLLTRGFGYWYVGERKKGVVWFFLVGFASRASMETKDPLASNVISILVEIALAVLAVDAYRIGAAALKRRVESLHTPPAPIEPEAGMDSTLPVGLACLLGLGYVGLAALGIMMPDYSNLKQSRATTALVNTETVYTNPDYGIQARLPAGWKFEPRDNTTLFRATHPDGVCEVDLVIGSIAPFVSSEAQLKELGLELRKKHQNVQLQSRQASSLGALPARADTYRLRSDNVDLSQTYLVARRRLTFYAMVSTSLAGEENGCGPDMNKIREGVTISK